VDRATERKTVSDPAKAWLAVAAVILVIAILITTNAYQRVQNYPPVVRQVVFGVW
jgi:uncharacterized membrane protein